MKNKLHSIIRERLSKYRKESLACLYPPAGWQWGCVSRKYKGKTLNLVNKIMRNISVEAWPSKNTGRRISIANCGWTMKLGWEGNRRTVDLCYRNDDHTAWCIERAGKYINFDIGGS